MIELSRRELLAGAAALPAAASAATVAKRPNILFIMADDLGYADVSCYGRRDYRTPAIDGLAAAGIRFTSAYANSAVCSATRTALITGRYQYRLPIGLEEPLGARDVGLPPDHPTLPWLMREAGYHTALVGKWHLGQLPKYGPLQSGYESFWGFRGGGVDYFTHAGFSVHDLWDGDHEVQETGYLTDLLGDRAISLIGDYARSDRPFLISLHFSAPHWPWEGPDDQAESRRIAASKSPTATMDYDGGSLATYAKMVTRLDYQIGRVLQALEKAALADNTIVVFTSDNGGERFSDNWPFSGKKTELLEGGIRIPAIVRWPGVAAPGSVSDQPIMSMDWMPTFLAAASVGLGEPLDGINLREAIDGAPSVSRTLFWRYRNLDQQACREGDWKYLQVGPNQFLFNVVDDPLERANLKDRYPDRFEALTGKYQAWNATMLPLDPAANSGGSSAATTADRYATTPPAL